MRKKQLNPIIKTGVVTTLMLCSVAWSQVDSELVRLVDCPTAGLISKGRYGIDMRLFPNGGVLGQIDAGVLKRISIGISFGGTQIIGDDAISWYPRVEASARYRVIEETQGLPALLFGYETQGFGAHQDNRYQIKSKGLYGAMSKNYMSGLGQFGVHGGVNLTRENGEDGDLSGWLGIDKSINEELMIVGEYDFAINDNEDDSLGSGKGYLNLGAYWSAVPNVSIGFLMKNILRNRDDDSHSEGVNLMTSQEQLAADPDISREISIRYTEVF